MKTRTLLPRQLAEIAALLEADQVVALPTETVYGLAARAESRGAVGRIFAVKERPADNPLIVHAATPEDALALGREVPAYATLLAAAFWPGPLSLVVESGVAWPWVQAGHHTLAVRVPEPAWLRELIRRVGPLAAPSANRSGRPSPTTAQHCLADLAGRIPAVVDGGSCRAGLESTVVDCTGPAPVILRPGPVTAEMVSDALAEDREVTAVGGRSASPGTRHPHYQPRARVVLVPPGSWTEGAACTDCMVIAPAAGEDSGHRSGAAVEGAGAEGDTAARIDRRWQDLPELARNLYAWFREADRAGVSTIYVQEIGRYGLGAALMNRLEKAAARRGGEPGIPSTGDTES